MLRNWAKKIGSFSLTSGVDSISAEQEKAERLEELTPRTLQRFHVFAGLSHEERLIIAGKLRLHTLKPRGILFREGDQGDVDFLLFDGKLELHDSQGVSRVLVGGRESAAFVVSSLRPRKQTARALTPCRYLVLESSLLNNLLKPERRLSLDRSSGDIEYHFRELPAVRSMRTDTGKELMRAFNDDLHTGKFVLSSLPEMAMRMRETISDAAVSTEKISKILIQDPVIAPKIIRVSNSPLYYGRDRCYTVQQAVVRLGVETTRQLVFSFTMRELFSTDEPALVNAMRITWNDTVFTAAVAAALARRLEIFSPEEAMLAAILSNVGALSVFNYLENHAEIYNDPAALNDTLDELRTEVGSMVLEEWGIQAEFVECARYGMDWQRQRVGDGDLCDLIITANLHAAIGKRQVPRLDHVAACARTLQDKLAPEFAIQFMQGARREIHESSSLINH